MRILRSAVIIEGPDMLRRMNELKASGYTVVWSGQGQMCLEAPEPGAPLPEPAEVVTNIPATPSRPDITFPRKKHSHRCKVCNEAVYCYKSQCRKPQQIDACMNCLFNRRIAEMRAQEEQDARSMEAAK